MPLGSKDRPLGWEMPWSFPQMFWRFLFLFSLFFTRMPCYVWRYRDMTCSFNKETKFCVSWHEASLSPTTTSYLTQTELKLHMLLSEELTYFWKLLLRNRQQYLTHKSVGFCILKFLFRPGSLLKLSLVPLGLSPTPTAEPDPRGRGPAVNHAATGEAAHKSLSRNDFWEVSDQ